MKGITIDRYVIRYVEVYVYNFPINAYVGYVV